MRLRLNHLTGITVGGMTYGLVHAGTDNSERTKPGSVWFHHTAYWGQQVFVEVEDRTRLRLCLAGHEAPPKALPAES